MRIGIIGAGVIGATAALKLARRGHEVTLIDREGIAAGASKGNAGAFAFSDIVPLATPGIMRKAPGWLLDPLGPLSIPPAYALRIAPWLFRFWRASWKDRYGAALAAQSALMALSRDALEDLVRDHGLADLLRREGQLQVYDGARGFDAAQPGWEARKAAGIRFELLTSADRIAEIQPGLAQRFTHGAFTPDWINVTDPLDWTARIAARASELGATLERRDVAAIQPEETGLRLHGPDGETAFDRVILAAGAWSRRLLDPLGLPLPLETERGYNTTFSATGFDLRTHLTFSDHGFVVTRIGAEMRVGGAVELGGLDAPPNMARAEALLSKARDFLPALEVGDGRQWMGFRPSMPDSLPVIGAHPGCPALVLAFGHGHLGLTQSAATAELLADLVDGRPPRLNLAPFSPTRFGAHHR